MDEKTSDTRPSFEGKHLNCHDNTCGRASVNRIAIQISGLVEKVEESVST